MATTLPTYTRTLDDAFVTTWYEIREEAIDNILDATVIWNILMGAGSFTPQMGGEIITRTIRHGTIAASNVVKGDVMTSGEPDLETLARWDWRYIASSIQRSTFDDQKNAGPSKIKDYVGVRITAARDGMEAILETDILTAFQSDETGKIMQGLNDIIPPKANRSSGTYGGINRPLTYGTATIQKPATGNTWWGPYYRDGTKATIDVDMLDDMKSLYNGLHNNQSAPNLIIMTQDHFEIYETFALDISQIIKDESTRLADLGFEVLRFKGKPVIWAANMTADNMLMINTDFIEVVYDPGLWFDMTDWKPIPFEFDRVAQILAAMTPVSTQLRRHGRMTYA